MTVSNTTSVERLRVVSRFEGLRTVLLSDKYADCLDRPLAYWALPTDRRLPLAFLGRPLKELLGTPFSDLLSTPGIGQKKIRCFVNLLSRVAHSDPTDLPLDLATGRGNGRSQTSGAVPSDGFDVAAVSEAVWRQWQTTVIRHDLGAEPLGRFAPSLKGMTRVIWNAPLGAYTSSTLSEIRVMKTHGEKRVRAILEVFHCVHNLAGNIGTQDGLSVRIVPQLIERVETWIGRILQTPSMPDAEGIFERFVTPLLGQIRIDASPQVVSLAENRLGIDGPIISIRQVARTMALTRARVYQLLNEINDIISVRWPLGRHQVYELLDRFQAQAADMDGPPDSGLFHAAVELFYPNSRRGAAGPLQRTVEPAE